MKILKWSIADEYCHYNETLTKTYLSDISFPSALKCTDAKCNSSAHKQEIDLFYNNLFYNNLCSWRLCHLASGW